MNQKKIFLEKLTYHNVTLPRQMEIFVLMIAMAMMTVFGLVATVIELKGKLNLESLVILAAISSFATAIVSNRQRIIIICAHVLHS